jgi:molybdopterin molybdotransferase
MPEFLNVQEPDAAFETLRERLSPNVERELIATAEALGRVTAEDILSPEDLPSFPRATMDGFSVRSSDTFGATEGLPAYLDVVGEVPMGQAVRPSLSPGKAARAYTGGMLAEGADAVVMIEQTQPVDEATIEVLRPVAPGENVVQVGEDVRAGGEVLPAGHVIRPQDIGGMLALGITQVEVGRRPLVGILSTGDELVPPERMPELGQVRDINTYTLSALVARSGGVPVYAGLVADDYEAQLDAAARALERTDILVFSAGSSVSSHDMTASIIGSLGSPGVLVHGISLKPGKPTIVGLVDGKPVFGLPGNPVSAMVVFDLLVRPTICLLGGCAEPPVPPTMQARLLRDVASMAGREDYVQVRLVHRNGGLCADPVFGKSNLIYTLVRADGVVKVPLDKGGLYAGEDVDVRVY